MKAGQDISTEVFEWIEWADTFLVFGTANYGEDTGNPASSCMEAKYAQNERKRIILLRMIPWNAKHDHLQARVLFGMNSLTLEWQPGARMPITLVEDIVRALELDDRHSDDTQKIPEPEPEPEPEPKPVPTQVSHMHAHGVLHRDLKPENILLESSAADAPIKVAA